MKKFSKGVLLASLISLSTTAVVAPVGVYYQQQTVKHAENNHSAPAVDYDLVTSFLDQDSVSKSVLQSAVVNLSEPTTNASSTTAETLASLTSAQKALVKQNQDELLAFFKSNTYTTTQINDYLLTNVPGYADAYHKSDQSLIAPLATTNDTERVANQAFRFALQGTSSDVTKNISTELFNTLRTARDVLVGLSVAAAITAAGLLIASVFTGGIMGTIGGICAWASSALGAAGSAVDLYLITFKAKIDALTVVSSVFDAYTIAQFIAEQIIKPIITMVTGIVTSFSWAFPALLIINATIATILVLLDHLL